MFRTFRWAGPLVALALVLPAAPAADKGKMPGDKKEAAAKMIAAGELTGKVVNVEADKKSLTLQLTVAYQVPNLGEIQAIANDKLQMAQSRDINQIRNLQVSILKHQANMYQLKTESHNVDIAAGDDIQVRTKEPPPQFDDKGNPKRYTAKELKELKGDSKLPGYTADFDSLKPEQIIVVKLAKMKSTPRPRGKDADKDLLASDNRPVATLIVIVREAPEK
jgi:hypothetical protein